MLIDIKHHDYLAGVHQNVNVAASPTFAGLTVSGLTATRVPYAGVGGVLGDSANFIWDNTNSRLGLGIASPTYRLDVRGTLASHSIHSNIGIDLTFVSTPTSTNMSVTAVADVTSNIEAGLHRYGVTFVTDIGETGIQFTASLPNLTTTAGQRVDISNIPISTDSRVIARRLYRSPAGGSYTAVAVLATINDNTTTTYSDKLSDTTLGTQRFYRVNTTNKAIMKDSLVAMTLDSKQTSFGELTMQSTTSGGSNTAFGYECGRYLTTGNTNSFFGENAGRANTTASGNTLIGYYAGRLITTGGRNTILGEWTGYSTIEGTNNTFLGAQAARYFIGTSSTNARNTIVGTYAGWGVSTVTTVRDTTILGAYAGYSITTALRCIYIGSYAGYRQTSDTDRLIIDNQQRADSATEQSNAIIYGVMAATPASQTLSLNAATSISQTLGVTGLSTLTGGIQIGATGNVEKVTNDLTITTASQKTLVLSQAVYKDINIAGALLSKPTSSAPGTDTFRTSAAANTNIETYAFTIGEKVHGGFELQHDYEEGTDLTFHVHFQIIDAPSGTDNVQWRLTYVMLRDGVTLSAVTTIDSPDTPVDTQYRAYRSDFAAIDGTNFKIGDQMMFTLERVAADGDAFSGECLIETAGIHYECDTLGSRQIGTK